VAGGASNDPAGSDHEGDHHAAQLGASERDSAHHRPAHATATAQGRTLGDVGGYGPARGGRSRRKRIKAGTIELLCRLKRDVSPDFSLQHFYEDVSEKHGVKVDKRALVVALDERPAQLSDSVRPATPMAPGRPTRHDYEYARCGTANVFCIIEPKAGVIRPTPPKLAPRCSLQGR
jgi:hypothetical protein